MNLDVVVCAKNCAKLLNRVLKQITIEVPFKSLIVVYASSTDGTEKVAQRYTNKVFWDGDKGLGAARNLGMRKATSGIVAMIDSDVILTEGWYERLIRHFKGDPKVAGAVGSNIFGYGYEPLEKLWKYWNKVGHENWTCSNTMLSRNAVLEVGNFRETLRVAGEDLDLYRRLSKAGYRWVWDKEAVVYHSMGVSEFFEHVRWWARSPSYLEEVTIKSLFNKFLGGFSLGMKLSVLVHPTMLLYYPLLRMNVLATILMELRKRGRPARA